MTHAVLPRCPGCGEEMVLEIDPAAPLDEQAEVLLADPPFRYACASAECPGIDAGG